MSRGPRKLRDFEGAWTLVRSIEDRLSGKKGQLTGTAVLTPSDAGLRYEENGALTYGDEPPLTASRVYLWSKGKAGSIDVAFGDGGEFHSFSLGRTMPEATHICDPDMYYVTYDFSSWPRWSNAWRVVGPRKNYRMQSTYVRER